MRARAVLVSAALVCACQQGSGPADPGPAAPAPSAAPSPATAPAPAPTPAPSPAPVADDADAYARDIDRICRVQELSEVDKQPGVNPVVATAQWLSANLETDAGRQFVIRVNGLPEQERGPAYDTEATRVGLAACPTARAWEKTAAH